MLTLYFASVHGERTRLEANAMTEKNNEVSCDLLAAPPRVINIGLEIFAANLADQGAKVAHVRWSPPAGGNSRLAGLLEKLQGK
jgi:hypothetical protein